MTERSVCSFESSGTLLSGGKEIRYRTVCADYPVYGDDGEELGTMFSYSYIRTDPAPDAQRPVLFAFNGGPGSSALWLHMGLLAPERVRLGGGLNPPAVPPFELEENPLCLLDVCDLVVIDPMGTGYGWLNGPARAMDAFSLEGDARIFADFIEDWTTREDRWDSPKYLLGESYGTMRACLLPDILTGGPMQAGALARGVAINGVILSGLCLSVNPTPNLWDEYGVERAVLDLPSMAAANWYISHDQKADLRAFVDEAYAFCGEYLTALYRGRSLSAKEQTALLEKLICYTGLPADYLKRKSYRPTAEDFARLRLYGEGKVLGSYDTRFTLPQVERGGTPDPVADDGSMGRCMPAFRGAFMKYAKTALNIRMERPFNIINFNVNGVWNYTGVKTPFQHLQSALKRNPDLRVLFCSGMYDLVTTMGHARYAMRQLEYADGQVSAAEYPAGHMQYLGEESFRMLTTDLRNFILGNPISSCE